MFSLRISFFFGVERVGGEKGSAAVWKQYIDTAGLFPLGLIRIPMDFRSISKNDGGRMPLAAVVGNNETIINTRTHCASTWHTHGAHCTHCQQWQMNNLIRFHTQFQI